MVPTRPGAQRAERIGAEGELQFRWWQEVQPAECFCPPRDLMHSDVRNATILNCHRSGAKFISSYLSPGVR